MKAHALALVLLAGGPALAAQYETEIDIRNEQDLFDLYARKEISDTSLETLVELLRDGVELNRASREELYSLPNLTLAQAEAILTYREHAGRIANPAELVGAEILSGAQLEQLAPFLLLEPDSGHPWQSTARLRGAWGSADLVAPPAALQLWARNRDFSSGLALLGSRLELGQVRYDFNREALVAAPAGYGPQLPKLYLRWKTPGRSLTLGTFRAGFGQRLTLDNTSRYTPDGFYPDDQVLQPSDDQARLCRLSSGEEGAESCTPKQQGTYVTPDFDSRESFRGVAASLEELPLAPGAALSLRALASYQSRSVYQYALYDRRHCSDPRLEGESCGAPEVYLSQPNPLDPAPRISYSTLPGVYDELLAGGNLWLKLSPTVRTGLTGYWAAPRWRVAEARLDFQEWSRYPFGGPFGAVGLDTAVQLGKVELAVEGARSFDAITGGGGGFGLLQRLTAGSKSQELEFSLRYYERGFANPYARPIAGPDLFEGNRARNEAGARLHYLGRPNEQWALRAMVDLWLWPQEGRASGTRGRSSLYSSLRADFAGFRRLELGAWVDYRDKDLRQGGRGQCYESSSEENELGEPLPCSGQLIRLAGKARLNLSPVALSLQYQHELLDDPRYPSRFRQDQVVWGEVSYRPVDGLRLRARSRYLDEALDSDLHLERSLWTYLDASWAASRRLALHLRGGTLQRFDRRESTLRLTQNPTYQLRLELQTKF